ncbi:Triosephosphate isomerase [Paraburkholderia phenoliruptrix]|uniref:Triosephosphate isomerase n=2 Tax=Paraburkholderia phenoliruptrix TaxID=252970 RepID=A0A6J5K6R3_9BURK|nr:Triosephosphate isomerase [Paraburkholderia phenoliruptrix]
MAHAYRDKLVVGNWKMHGNTLENQARFDALRGHVRRYTETVKIAVCVPFPYLPQAERGLHQSGISWGTQDVSPHAHGAYTGEVSADMAREFGARYVIVGHSERRAYHSESATEIAMKARRALESGLTPIVCVGESLEERELDRTNDVVASQLNTVLDSLSVYERLQLVFAYEPVWAIGTGRTASPAQAQDVHAHIRTLLVSRDRELVNLSILYGGSVKAGNAENLFAETDIDGALVGGASLDPVEFTGICAAAHQAAQK